MKTQNIGIIGGGLMGKEIASAFARWCSLEQPAVRPVLTSVCDLNPAALQWFDRIPTVTQKTSDIDELLANQSIDIVYVALPHNLHQSVYNKALAAGKSLLAEKPFGIDLSAAESIVATVEKTNGFTRCSSEFPFYPGAQYALKYLRKNDVGRVLEAQFGFHHSSDLDRTKPANWKRLSKTCGTIGVMGDLGMHVTHIPLRMGWKPTSVYAQLQKGFPHRKDGQGNSVACDTYDNAVLHSWAHANGEAFPLRFEMKRMAPGQTNTWFFQVLGTKAGVRYSTSEPKTIWTYRNDTAEVRRQGLEQKWQRQYLGFQMEFPCITGGIFEPGFPDVIQQMWAAFLEEREGNLNGRFGCVTPSEALFSHRLFAAALQSHESGQVVALS